MLPGGAAAGVGCFAVGAVLPWSLFPGLPFRVSGELACPRGPPPGAEPVRSPAPCGAEPVPAVPEPRVPASVLRPGPEGLPGPRVRVLPADGAEPGEALPPLSAPLLRGREPCPHSARWGRSPSSPRPRRRWRPPSLAVALKTAAHKLVQASRTRGDRTDLIKILHRHYQNSKNDFGEMEKMTKFMWNCLGPEESRQHWKGESLELCQPPSGKHPSLRLTFGKRLLS
ncbi:uncharacterized protein [Manis javanica]|uniref:uncharacterized protein isoform X1 n=1 Tax=Manis javanica TaxID=9974 RepID=UPI003C6D1FC0